MEHEEYYAFMMDALDGELSDENRLELEAHLRACPPCLREWHAVAAIDTLFRQSSMLVPAADFTQRTLARLPSRQARLWLIGSIYTLLLLVGLLPVIGAIWLVTAVGPDLLPSIAERITSILAVIGTLLRALGNGAGELIAQYPAIVGWSFVMVGLLFVWNGMYRQLIQQPRRV